MLGVEKSTILESPDPEIAKVKLRGEPTEAKNRFTFINTPRIQIELVEPDSSSPSTWLEHLEKYGERRTPYCILCRQCGREKGSY